MKINIHLNPSFLFNSQITYFFSVRNVGQKVKMSFKRQTGIPVHSWLNFEASNYQLTLRLLERPFNSLKLTSNPPIFSIGHSSKLMTRYNIWKPSCTQGRFYCHTEEEIHPIIIYQIFLLHAIGLNESVIDYHPTKTGKYPRIDLITIPNYQTLPLPW